MRRLQPETLTHPTPSSPPRLQVTTTEVSRGEQHSGAIFTLTYDAEADSVITTGRDGKMVTWASDGSARQALQLDSCYACSADVNSRHNSLLLCGVPRVATDGQAGACIFHFRRQNAAGPWERVGLLPRPEMKIVTAVRCVGGGATNCFATGEQLAGGAAPRKDCVCVYDIGAAPFESLQPQTAYWEHNDIITCLVAHSHESELFFSGSKDNTIKLWDKRVARQSAATMGGMLAGGGGWRPGHQQMITCIDTFENTLVSAGLDEKMMVWDVRMMSRSACV